MTLSKEVMKPRTHFPVHLLFYGENNALLSDILHHTSEHARTLSRDCFVIFRLFGVKLLFHSKEKIFGTGRINHLLAAGVCLAYTAYENL